MNVVLKQIGSHIGRVVSDLELTDDLREQVAKSAPSGEEGWRLFYQSLSRHPADPGTFYLAADRLGDPEPHKLLVFSRVSREASKEDAMCEVRPFAATDREAVQNFASTIDPSLLPRPQREQPAVAVGNRHPEVSLPAAFDAFGRILNDTGLNMASTVQLSATREMTVDEGIARRDGEDPTAIGHTRVSIEHLYHAGLWAAIRAGWRHGYTAEADHFIISGSTPDEIAASTEATKEAIRRASGYTKFTTDTSRLFQLEADTRHPNAWSDQQVEAEFAQTLSEDERSWVLAEFESPAALDGYDYRFSPAEVRRLAVKFAESLKLNEELHDFIREQKQGGKFDFEPSIDEAETLTTPKELLFYMHWLAARGRPASLVPPNLGFKKRQAYPEAQSALEEYAARKMWPELAPRTAQEFNSQPVDELENRVAELAAVARHFNGTLSIHSGSGKQARVLSMIGRATRGRVNYKISGELQLQLLDVLSQQPAGSPWRSLFEQMVDRCYEFAGLGAFGTESALAATYRERGLDYYLGDASRGRVDGNLFLVFWIGNLVGTRDRNSPDGDQRFFKEKINELPSDLLDEVRRRNSDYIVWLAGHLKA